MNLESALSTLIPPPWTLSALFNLRWNNSSGTDYRWQANLCDTHGAYRIGFGQSPDEAIADAISEGNSIRVFDPPPTLSADESATVKSVLTNLLKRSPAQRINRRI